MRRREFFGVLGGAAAAWPVMARTQQAMPVVGVLSSQAGDPAASRVAGFLKGLSEQGCFHGRNVRIEYSWADGYNNGDALEGATSDALASDLGEEALNHVEPGRRGRGQVQVEARMFLEPSLRDRSLNDWHSCRRSDADRERPEFTRRRSFDGIEWGGRWTGERFCASP